MSMNPKMYVFQQLMQEELMRRRSLTPQERAAEDKTVSLFQSAAPVGREFGAKPACGKRKFRTRA